MREAHEVADGADAGLSKVVVALRQRLGQERMALWFGSSVAWKLGEDRTVQVLVNSQFLSECIQRMFREDLRMAVSQVFGENWGVAMVVSEGNSSQISEETSRKASEIAYHGAHVLPGKPKSIEGSASVLDSHSVATLSIESIQPPVNAKSAYKPIRDEAEAGGIPELEGSSIGDASAEAAPPPVSFRVVRATGPGVESREGGFSPADAADREIERLVSLRRQQERRWDEFVVGVHNKMAWTGAEMVLDRPGQVSPLLIHGPHGVGKTHLAVGLSQRLKQRYQYRRVLFTTGEQFTIEYSESARNGGFASFRKKYRDLEVLVIDDLQFCLGKTGTLVELRNTIEALIRDNRQIILVSDRSAHDLGGLGSDLNARIQGGMTCSIDPMDCQTRRALLERMCVKQSLSISEEVLDWVAEQCGGDARVLQGILHRLIAKQRIVGGSTLNRDDAISAISDIVRANRPIVRLGDIDKAVCDAFGLREDMLRTKSKCQTLSQPRMLAMFLARKYTRTALSEIGGYFGNRQHSTVISAQKKVESWIDANELLQVGQTQMQVQEILRSLEASLQVG